MGAMGTDVAIETADVALLGEDLRHLPQALQHARHARRVLVQNLFLSAAIFCCSFNSQPRESSGSPPSS